MVAQEKTGADSEFRERVCANFIFFKFMPLRGILVEEFLCYCRFRLFFPILFENNFQSS